MGNNDDSWDSFDPDHWDDEATSANGHTPHEVGDATGASNGMLRPAIADVDDEAGATTHAGGGRWVSRGGVLRWEPDSQSDDGSDAPLREDAQSDWANDEITLPLGAPQQARLRAVRAWVARRRIRETELIGALLLERRRLAGSHGDEDDEASTSHSTPENPNDPLALALAEAQAAADEYETLLGSLEDTRAHVGAQGALVEFYLAINDRLATLAAHPAAAEGFAQSALFAEIERQPASTPLTPAARSEWEGRAGAALATRKRVEQVSAAEPEDD